MHLLSSARVAAALILLASGCPKSGTVTSPATSKPKDHPQVGKFAQILRAADRRIIDDDLRALLGDEDAAVRAQAALALGQIGDPLCLPQLETAANDPAPGPRARAAFAMGLIADPSSEAALTRLAEDAEAAVRVAAVEALGRLHAAGSVSTVGRLLADSEMAVRAAAALDRAGRIFESQRKPELARDAYTKLDFHE
jgi:HEAT repeat protein